MRLHQARVHTAPVAHSVCHQKLHNLKTHFAKVRLFCLLQTVPHVAKRAAVQVHWVSQRDDDDAETATLRECACLQCDRLTFFESNATAADVLDANANRRDASQCLNKNCTFMLLSDSHTIYKHATLKCKPRCNASKTHLSSALTYGDPASHIR